MTIDIENPGASEDQLSAALRGLTDSREVLAEDRQYFVDPVLGNDANTGASAGSALQTVQAAIDKVCDTLDFRNGAFVEIKLQDGQHTTPIMLRDYVGAGSPGYFSDGQLQLGHPRVSLVGSESDLDAVVITGGLLATRPRLIEARNHLPWFINRVKFTSLLGQDAVEVGFGSHIYFGDLEFGNMEWGYGIWAPYKCAINFQKGTNRGSDIYFSGGNIYGFMIAYDGAHVHVWEHGTLNVTANTNFWAFIEIGEGCIMTMRRLDAVNLNGFTTTGIKANTWNDAQLFLSLNVGGEQNLSILPGDLPAIIDYGSANGVRMAIPNTQTNNYTLTHFDGRRDVHMNKATAVTVTLPKTLLEGWKTDVYQDGAGQITFAAETGATMNGLGGATKCAGQYGKVAVSVKANTDGQSAAWMISGDITT